MQDLTQRNRLSATVVLYHSGVEMLSCIQSFVDSDVYLDLYVVNNSPGDASLFTARWNCPGVHYYPVRRNIGYGRANNLIFPKLKSTYHVICNPDVTFAPDVLRRKNSGGGQANGESSAHGGGETALCRRNSIRAG